MNFFGYYEGRPITDPQEYLRIAMEHPDTFVLRAREDPPSRLKREVSPLRFNCVNCGAPRVGRDRCDYCGTGASDVAADGGQISVSAVYGYKVTRPGQTV